MINSLAQLSQLKVIARSSAFQYKGKDVDPQEAARTLGVQAIVIGRVVQRGDILQVRAELVDTRNKTQMWGDQYSRKVLDVQSVQEEISRAIAEKLLLRLTGAEERQLAKHATQNPQAYQLYMWGRYYAEKRTEEAYRKATEHYRQALDLDPTYAQAYVGLADAYFLYFLPASARERMPRSKAAAIKALAIDEKLAEAHTSLARVIWQYDWDWPAAEREFKRALELDPNSAFTHRIYGYYLASMGRHDESVAAMKKALELDPLSLIINLDVGHMLYFAGQYDQAMSQFRKTQEMDPNFTEVYDRLGMGYCRIGKYAEAVAELDRAYALSRNNQRTISYLGFAYGLWGKRDEAVKKLNELKELSRQKYVTPYESAIIYTGLREKDRAFDWLQRACDEREPMLVYLKVWPIYDALRTDPRFADLVRRVGLP